MVDVGVLLTVTVTIDITPYCYLPIGVLTSPEAKHSGFPTYLNAMNTASRYMPSARERGVVQKPLAPGYTERRQSRAGQGIPHLECYPDLNHALMRVVVTVPLPDRRTGEPRILKTHLFDFFDLSTNEASDRATVRFGLPERLQPILAGSNRWGRIKAEVVCAMSSKYAIALYEL